VLELFQGRQLRVRLKARCSKLRGSDTPPEPSPFFSELEDSEAQVQFILGSPMRALSIENGFDRHYFFDLDESRAQTLADQFKTAKNVTVKVGNELCLNLGDGV
jgi:23S rRNA A2030 N6-methylase RlmJ